MDTDNGNGNYDEAKPYKTQIHKICKPHLDSSYCYLYVFNSLCVIITLYTHTPSVYVNTIPSIQHYIILLYIYDVTQISTQPWRNIVPGFYRQKLPAQNRAAYSDVILFLKTCEDNRSQRRTDRITAGNFYNLNCDMNLKLNFYKCK